MPEQSPPPIAVILEQASTQEDEQVVADLFAKFGLATDVLVQLRESVEIPQALAWFVVLSMPIQAFLAVYCGAIAKRLGDDSYDAAKHVVTSLWQARKARSGSKGYVVLRDDELAVQLLLEETLPKEAYQALDQLDPKSLKHGDSLQYDAEQGVWRPQQ